MSDLIQASLAEIRARLAGGDVSAEAVAKACLDRIAETEPSIHALITVRDQDRHVPAEAVGSTITFDTGGGH